MTRWIRFELEGEDAFGTLEGETVVVHRGDMFGETAATGTRLALSDVTLLTPCQPGKMIALWNNFHALAAKLGLATPLHPLYFFKAATSFLAGGGAIRRPAGYDGRIIYEGELGIVIGKTCSHIDEAAAADHIFGYTCINDVTAVDILNADSSFPQWARAKSFDSFGVFGPVIATGLDPAGLVVRTILNGQERQNYPVSDIVFQPARIVSLISRDMTLQPGDVIACGTSVGAGSMKEARNEVTIRIEGIGELTNLFEQSH